VQAMQGFTTSGVGFGSNRATAQPRNSAVKSFPQLKPDFPRTLAFYSQFSTPNSQLANGQCQPHAANARIGYLPSAICRLERLRCVSTRGDKGLWNEPVRVTIPG